MESDGKPAPPDATKGASLIFEGNRYALKGGQEEFRGTFTLDPAMKPKAIDTTFVEEDGKERGKALGIYKLEGNRLTICWRQGGRERPTEFRTDPGSGLRMIVVQRD
jgi:uncharacterized protein (TIGR03067 family)